MRPEWIWAAKGGEVERIPLAGLCAAGGFSSVAVVLFLRRVAGGPLDHLPPGEAAVYTALFAVAAMVVAWAVCTSRRHRHWNGVAVLVVSLVFASGLSNEPLTTLTCLAVIATVVVLARPTNRAWNAEESASVLSPPRECEGPPPQMPAMARAPEIVPGEPSVETAPQVAAKSQLEDAEFFEPTLQICRNRFPDQPALQGRVCFELPAGETVATLHVPLWPPLPSVPIVHCELEGIEGRVSVPLAKPHGLRLEVRVPEPVDEPLAGAVRFVGECRPAAAA